MRDNMRRRSNLQYLAAANSLLGTPWTPQTNCWWLVREFFRRIGGPSLPNIDVNNESAAHVQEIIRVCNAGGLRLVPGGTVEELDIVLMRNIETDRRHVGVALYANGAMSLLHSEGRVDTAQPRRRRSDDHSVACTGPGVVCEKLETALVRYRHPELWRKEPTL